jgi:hypothetical protein
MSKDSMNGLMDLLKKRLIDNSEIALISWMAEGSGEQFWESIRRDLEIRHEIDAIRWHMGVVKEQAAQTHVLALADGVPIANGLGRVIFTVKST